VSSFASTEVKVKRDQRSGETHAARLARAELYVHIVRTDRLQLYSTSYY